MQLNTSHPLHSRLISLIGVNESNALVDLVTPARTFTLAPNTSVGSGIWGRHFQTSNASNPNFTGFVCDTDINTGDATELTVVMILHDYARMWTPGGGGFLVGPGETIGTSLRAGGFAWNNAAARVALFGYSSSTGQTEYSDISTLVSGTQSTPIMLAGTISPGANESRVYRDGDLVGTTTSVSSGVGNAIHKNFFGLPANQTLTGKLVWYALFDKALSTQEVADLYASLGADNAFALVATAGDPPLGTVTISTVTPGETTASVEYSYNDTDQTGFEYRLNAGTAASIGASPATITGLTASTTYDIEVRAINANGSGTWSAVSEFTTTAVANTAPTFDGPDIANISGTEVVALTPLDVSARFSDAESGLTFSAVGTWPAGVTVSSAGVISGTPTTAGTYAGLQVRATDTGALTADSNTFTITVAAAPAVYTITVTDPIRNNTGTLLANQSGVRVAVLQAADMVSVHEDTGLTTNASGVLAAISDVAIVSGTSYHVAIKLADGSVGITGPITAS